ncbi:MAG: hypothetical protein ABSE62_02360 [Chthoniobacteraceae bacterium]|jgi:hypothetical protein
MDFAALIIFLALYYLRPQEWLSVFNSIHFVQILSVMAIWALFQKHKINFKKLVQTPLDWLMLSYFVWTLIAGFEPRHTFSGIQAVILFYFVAVTSLDSIPRLKKFLGWWCLFTFLIAALAVASMYGFDPLGGYDIVQGDMKGRLMLNLSVFDNPNALAHSIIPALPLFYYLFYWRRVTMKAGMLLLAVPLYCLFLTQSKGGFLCGFVTLLATLMFGRSRIWQILILTIAIGFGYGALYALPRMTELDHSKTDPAIQGRVAAFTYGLELMRTHFFGIGLGNFQATFLAHGPLEKKTVMRVIPPKVVASSDGSVHELDAERHRITEWDHFSKATHCSYNQNGAELGYIGLFLFVGILYCCLRTLVLVRSHDDDEERIRRLLFAMVVAYAASSWMVDFCYRPTFFMMVAAISAFHRHLLRKYSDGAEPVPAQPAVPDRPWLRRIPPIRMPGIPIPGIPGLAAPLAGGAAACVATAPAEPAMVLQPVMGDSGASENWSPAKPRRMPWDLDETLRKKFLWNRLGFMDLLIMVALTYAAIRYWEYLITKM